MTTRLTIVYYSATGNVHALAQAVRAGAEEAGAQVRLRRVPELAPREAVASNPEWAAHAAATQDVPEASHDDLLWADALIFGTPTRFGVMASQLKQFIDTTGGIWEAGRLADKVASGFVSTAEQHGGQESTLLGLYNVFIHWGCIVVPPGYTDECIFPAGGNPYGSSAIGAPDEADLAAARYQGRRVVEKAALLSPALVG